MKKTASFSVLELKKTLYDILDNGTNVCVRFRLVGAMWQSNFVRVVSIIDNRVLVRDEVKNQLTSIDLTSVMQFEVDHRFKVLEPHFHYTITIN